MPTDDTRDRAVRRVLIVEMLLNLLVAAAKGIYGVWSGSLAIASDAVHSVVDASANLVGITLLRLSAAAPDEKHPYGHRKVEIVAAAGVGIIIGVVAVRFAWSAIEALIAGGSSPTTSVAGFVVIIGTLLVNIFVAIYEARKAKQLNSPFLEADAKHTATDVLVTCAVLVSYVAAYYGVAWADPAGALAVVVVIAVVAWRIVSSNLSVLVDAVAVDPEQVRAVALEVAGVAGCHRIRSRGTSPSVHVDLHLLIDGATELRRAHEIAHQVEDAVCAALPSVSDVTIHMEPEDDDDDDLVKAD